MSATVADFFCGLGGASEGARQAGASVLFAANHWPEAVQWHSANHGTTQHACQDLQQLDMRALPAGLDVLWAAPECQGHSQNSQPARKGTGGSHAPDLERAQARTILQRSTAWAVVAAAEVARPRTLLIENVPEIQSWALFDGWRSCLESLGYVVRVHTIRATEYGSCQDRQRAIITARIGEPLDLVPSWGEISSPRRVGDCLDLDRNHPAHRWSDIDSKSERMRTRMRKAQREAGTVCLWNNVSEAKGRNLDGYAPTLTTKSGSQLYLLDGDQGRILNPRELARIQGFPESYALPTQRALAGHLIGNAIDVAVSRGVTQQALAS